MELIEGLQKLLPWATNLPIVPKIVLSVILVLFTVLILLLIWYPISPHQKTKDLPQELLEIGQMMADESTGGKKLQHLMVYLNRHSINSEFLKTFADNPSDLDIHVRPIDRFLLVTVSLWRNSGLLVVLGPEPGVLALLDDDMGIGIKDLKIISQPSAFPIALLAVRILVFVGTGTYAESIKIYAVDSGNIFLSLEKPYFEYNSGWGTFKTDLVTFKLKNEYLVNSESLVEIHTKGAAILGNEKNNTGYRELPEERYVWDRRTRSFKQTSGRDVHGRPLLTEIYGDLGGAVGHWFRTPEEVRERIDFLKTLEEKW